MIDKLTADLRSLYSKEESARIEYERELEFFNEDTDYIFEEICDKIEHIMAIESGYNNDFLDVIRNNINNIIKTCIGEEKE